MKSVKLVSFEDNPTPGVGVGPVEGSSCQSSFLNIPLGRKPSLDQSFADARKSQTLRYMNNVYSSIEHSDYIIYRERCYIVKGAGYK